MKNRLIEVLIEWTLITCIVMATATVVGSVLHTIFDHTGTWLRVVVAAGLASAAWLFYEVARKSDTDLGTKFLCIFCCACAALCAVFSTGVLG